MMGMSDHYAENQGQPEPQPTLPGMEEESDTMKLARQMGEAMGRDIIEMLTPKARRHVEHHKKMDYAVTPAQRLQRTEMEAGVHQPVKLGQALSGLLGAQSRAPEEVIQQAWSVIEGTPNTLQLSVAQWAEVQKLVEVAIMVGMDWEPDEVPDH